MAFSSPFKPKGNISLQSPDIILPGAMLPIEIKVLPDEEVQPREVRAELTGEETYFVTVTHYRNGRAHTSTESRTNTFARINQVLAQQPSLTKGVEQKWNCTLQLPADAPQAASIGSTIKGQLVLQVKEKLSIRSIRVELVQVEKGQ